MDRFLFKYKIIIMFTAMSTGSNRLTFYAKSFAFFQKFQHHNVVITKVCCLGTGPRTGATLSPCQYVWYKGWFGIPSVARYAPDVGYWYQTGIV